MRVVLRTGRAVSAVIHRRSVRFAFGSGAGLLVDLAVFAALTACGLAGFVSNLTSTALAISIVYLLVTRFAFRVSPTWRTYIAFLVWYSASALLVSTLIALIGHGDEIEVLIAKACSVPFTFITNFVFGRWLFSGGAERTARRSAPTRSPERSEPSARFGMEAPLGRGARRTRTISAAVVSLVFVVLVLPLNLALSFQQPLDRRGVLLSHVLQITFATAFFCGLLFLFRMVQIARAGSVRHRRWIGIAIAYFAVNLVVLALIYPGYWVWDEFYTLDVAKQYSTVSWQGYLTTLYYTAGLMLGPSPVVILLLQLATASLIVGYGTSLLMQRLARPWLAAFVALPLLSFPVLLNNQYPLRLTLYAYLMLLLVLRVAVLKQRRDLGLDTLPGFVGIASLVAVLAFWRSEGLVLILLLPVAFWIGGLHRLLVKRPAKTLLASGLGVAAVLTAGGITFATAVPGYQATAVINPLSTMLQGRLVSPQLNQDLDDIDAVLDLRGVRAAPSWTETPALWAGALRNGYTGSTGRLLPAFADLVVHNPGPFIDNRVRAFLAANAMQPSWLPQVQSQGVYGASTDVKGQLQHFGDTNTAVHPLDASLKYGTERTLLMWTDEQRLQPIASIVWNVLPIVLGVLGLAATAILRRRWWWAFASGLVLVNAMLVFLSEPAAYFMYFFPAYLLGGALLAAAVALLVDRALVRSQLDKTIIENSSSSSTPAASSSRWSARSWWSTTRRPVRSLE